MSELARFGVSMEEKLLLKFDELIQEKGYLNRSEAVRDLVRKTLVEDKWEQNNSVVMGTVTLVYNHEKRELAEKLTKHQHHHHAEIVSSMHVHINKNYCLEVIVLKGKAKIIRKIADEILGTKGVVHGKFIATTTGEDLE